MNDPIAVAFEGLIADLGSPDSQRAYRSDWARYTTWLTGENVEVAAARPRHVSAHIASLRDPNRKPKPMAKSTITRALSVIREVYGVLVRDEIIETNPAREIKNYKVNAAPKTPYLIEDQMTKLLNLPAEKWQERRDRMCIQLLFGLGLRRSEVARMRVEDFGENLHTVTGRLKGGKSYTVGVPAWIQESLTEWLTYAKITNGPILPRSVSNPNEISGDIVYQIVTSATELAGVEIVSPHALRRSNITILGEKGVSLKERQLAVGHASSATTERYDRAREAAKNAPGQMFADMIKKQ